MNSVPRSLLFPLVALASFGLGCGGSGGGKKPSSTAGTTGSTGGTTPPVVPVEPSRIVLAESVVNAAVGESVRLSASISGGDASGLEWVSETGSVVGAGATVDVSSDEVGRHRFVVRVKVTPAVQSSATVYVSHVKPRELGVDPLLRSPAAGAIWDVPVVVVLQVPSHDGTSNRPGTFENNEGVDFWIRRMERINVQRKFMREEASRDHGYRNLAALPSIGIRVVKTLVFFDDLVPEREVPWNKAHRFQDYNGLFSRLDARKMVEEEGVKEFWVCSPPNLKDLELVESNMSGPLGDTSNSTGWVDDLPVFDRTYTVYNFACGYYVNLHNEGHQFERLMSRAAGRQDGTSDLFWKAFAGQDSEGRFLQGRAGNCHFPPNGREDYDYWNANPVLSDIEDWRPDGTGAKKAVNRDTWESIPRNWPLGDGPRLRDKPYPADSVINDDATWYVYWMQNFPGRDSNIAYGNGEITNWWQFVGDWDGSVANGLHTGSGVAPSGRSAPTRLWPVR